MSDRKEEIVAEYITLLDKHIDELKAGDATDALEINDFAAMMHIHPRHLSNTLKEVLNKSPCSLYEARLLRISKELILETDDSIASIARHLTYDPSNFSKFFKSYTGTTPKKFRDEHLQKNLNVSPRL